MAREKKAAAPGRPKINSSIPKEQYLGVVDKPRYTSIATNEIIIPDSSTFNNFIKTLDSLKTSSLSIYFEEDGFSIKGKVDDNVQGGSTLKEVYIHISSSRVYSYYFSKPTMAELKSMSALSEFKTELDENTRFVILYTTDINDSIQYVVEDTKNDIKVSSSIITSNHIYNFDKLIFPEIIEDEIKLVISGYKTNNIKKIFSKKSRSSCSKAKLIAKNNVVTIEYKNEINNTTKLTMNSKKRNKILGQKENELYCIDFPKIDVDRFLMNIKTDVEFMFAKDYLIMKNIDYDIELLYLVYFSN